ncbi:MAG: hypothetical protein FWD47_13455 [Treponema sp.]|nr:hypothetical protein [Treponema sp.]
MPLSWAEIQENAIKFSKRWADTHREKADAQPFVTEFLGVFGVDDPVKVGEREKQVKISKDRYRYIDFFWENQIAIEMKSRGENLVKAYKQLSDYMALIKIEELPDLWMICDFETIHLWRRSTSEKFTFKLKELRKNIRRFANISGYVTERPVDERLQLNRTAAEKMSELHIALREHGYDGHDLEVYLVRLLFCLFAGDTEIFPKGHFFHYINDTKEDGSDLSDKLSRLFEILNMPDDIRAKKTLLAEEFKHFRYINGALFAERLPPADFNKKMRKLLLECREFDWSDINPAIFGAMFQGVMDKTQRRELGAHYTSVENILKLINPLFMDDLWIEFERVKTDPTALDHFHKKLASLKFLDPACGCGNFLIVAYWQLRELELEILKMKLDRDKYRQATIGGVTQSLEDEILVNVNQFYGIEIEDFPCQIAQVGMWLIDHQMNLHVADEFGIPFVRLPLKESATIVHANALRIDWEDIIPKSELSFIIGNPPFVGARLMNDLQKADMNHIFGKLKGVGNLDYVTTWYRKAANIMENTSMKSAFVSTNSIAQGEQPTILWKSLMERGLYINFGIPSFIWNNEAKGKAAVYCVIIGFSYHKTEPNINQYLLEAPSVFIDSRKKQISGAPELIFGNMPNDGGNLIIEADEYEDFIQKEPKSKSYIKKFVGAVEFINNRQRYCLWLEGISPLDLRSMPNIVARVERVRELRASSTREGTRKIADTPTLFGEIRQPKSDFILIPRHSSENRRYIPIGFISADIIAGDSNMIIPNATLYHFGILTSNVHMAWTRAVCGRLKRDYRYSKDIVYNNFPWVAATDEQRQSVTNMAQTVLDARLRFPTSSLADLYDPLAMPPELLKAHQNLDRTVMQLYGFPTKKSEFSEADCVAALMEMYQKLVNNG